MTDQTFQNDDLDGADAAAADEQLEVLKRKADMLGVKYGARIGVDALRAKINAKLNGEKDETEPEAAELSPAAREAKLRADVLAESMKLVRLRIANLNPSKKDLHGEIFTVGNKFLGTVRKFIPYGEATDNGYHVPNVIYQQLKERKFLQIKTRTVNGQIVIEQRWVPEFALEVMDQLTKTELNQLAASQAAAAGMSAA